MRADLEFLELRSAAIDVMVNRACSCFRTLQHPCSLCAAAYDKLAKVLGMKPVPVAEVQQMAMARERALQDESDEIACAVRVERASS